MKKKIYVKNEFVMKMSKGSPFELIHRKHSLLLNRPHSVIGSMYQCLVSAWKASVKAEISSVVAIGNHV